MLREASIIKSLHANPDNNNKKIQTQLHTSPLPGNSKTSSPALLGRRKFLAKHRQADRLYITFNSVENMSVVINAF